MLLPGQPQNCYSFIQQLQIPRSYDAQCLKDSGRLCSESLLLWFLSIFATGFDSVTQPHKTPTFQLRPLGSSLLIG